jgi:hypothetical protein
LDIIRQYAGQVLKFGICFLEFIPKYLTTGLSLQLYYGISAKVYPFAVFAIFTHPHPVKLVHDGFDEFGIGSHNT